MGGSYGLKGNPKLRKGGYWISIKGDARLVYTANLLNKIEKDPMLK